MILIRIDNAKMKSQSSLVGAPPRICALALSGCGMGQQNNASGRSTGEDYFEVMRSDLNTVPAGQGCP
jgi:hypothetical protein